MFFLRVIFDILICLSLPARGVPLSDSTFSHHVSVAMIESRKFALQTNYYTVLQYPAKQMKVWTTQMSYAFTQNLRCPSMTYHLMKAWKPHNS
jgi:hypothetical protein